MRVGKFLEHFQAALKATAIQDPYVSYTAIGRQLGYGFYLILDALQWIHGAKVYQFAPETAKSISKNAARFWLTGLTFSLVSGTYKTYNIRQRLARAGRARATAEKEAERKLELAQIKAEEGAVRYQMTQDALDWLIPATAPTSSASTRASSASPASPAPSWAPGPSGGPSTALLPRRSSRRRSSFPLSLLFLTCISAGPGDRMQQI